MIFQIIIGYYHFGQSQRIYDNNGRLSTKITRLTLIY